MGDSGYNPYDNRDVYSPLTNFDAFHFVLKSVLGLGTLAMPMAILSAGIIGGTLLTVIFSFLLIYGLHILIKCMVEASRRNKVGYMNLPETVAFALSEGPSCCRCCSKLAGHLADILIALTHYGLSVVYIVFVAECFKIYVRDFFNTVEIRYLIVVVGLLILPLFLIRKLLWLIPITITANVLTYIALFITLFPTLFVFLASAHDQETRSLFGNLQTLPLFVGFSMFSISSVGVMLTVESKMATPENYLGWCGTLGRCSYVMLSTNLFVGLYCYLFIGDQMFMEFFNNLPDALIWVDWSKACFAIAVILTYPINGYVSIDIILNHYVFQLKEESHKIEYAVRIVFVVLGTINAIALPVITPVVKLFGALTISIVNLILPALIELCLWYNDANGKSKSLLLKDIAIIIIGIIVLMLGCYGALWEMAVYYAELRTPEDRLLSNVELN